ncbi:MAG TPA: hypothetical protein ENK21_03360 [Trueperaceae bacterium]|nr:hypothetical protein [Trueperaceae bacterium]
MAKNYKYQIQNIQDYQLVSLQSNSSNSSFSIIPSLGASLNSVVLNGHNILWSATNLQEIQERTIKSYAGAQLAPFVNRIKDASYSFKQKKYNLVKNEPGLGNALHGFVFDKGFELVAINEAEGILKLSYDFKAQDAYPFDFAIENSFRLTDNSLTIDTAITNKSQEVIPIGHGWHPYFDIGGNIDDAHLQLAANKYFLVDEQFIPTGELKQFDKFAQLSQIAKTELDYCFPIDTSNNLVAQLFYPEKGLRISLLTEGYKYLQVYTPSDRKTIAIEPQTSAADAFNNGIGLIRLEPNQSINLKFQILASTTSYS